MSDDLPQGLRARRRLDTRREIHRAALELFEAQGVRGTTVQQIAERAGVSARTFFRYFTSKEQAGLPGQQRLLKAIDDLQLRGAEPSAVLGEVEAVLEGAMSPEHDEHRALAHLLARDSELRNLAATQERFLVDRLRERLSEQLPEAEQETALLAVEVAVTVWSTSWNRWGELAARGTVEDPVELYRRFRRELRNITSPGR